MSRVIAYHLIFTTYGFWLPNDPRGSWSTFVHSWDLFRAAGGATKTTQRRSLARDTHDHQARLAAKRSLARKPVQFTGQQAAAVGRGIANFLARSPVVVHACSILPQHVHVVIGRHDYPIEQTTNLLKGAATRALSKEGLHPFADQPYRNGTLPSPWARKQWSVFLHTDEDVRRAVKYVEDNPLKDGKRAQKWKWVAAWE